MQNDNNFIYYDFFEGNMIREPTCLEAWLSALFHNYKVVDSLLPEVEQELEAALTRGKLHQ